MFTRIVFCMLMALIDMVQAKPFLFGDLSPAPQKETKHIYHIIQVPNVPVSSFSNPPIVQQPPIWEKSIALVDHEGWEQSDIDVKKHDRAEVEHHYHTYDVNDAHVVPTFESSWPSSSSGSYPVAAPQYVQQQPLSVQIYPVNQQGLKTNNNDDILRGILISARGVLRLVIRGISSASAFFAQDNERQQNWP